MRIKITAQTGRPVSFSFNYQHVFQSAIYALIRESSSEYAGFLHDNGFIRDGIDKWFKMFTFSKLSFRPSCLTRSGFDRVRQIEFIFSTPVEKSLRHLILGIFSDRQMRLRLGGKDAFFDITGVDVLEDPQFSDRERFVCLSPIAVSTLRENPKGRLEPHFLNYMVTEERAHFVGNLKKNLVNKYETLNGVPYDNHDHPFDFHFDTAYIDRKKGAITKLIHFKKGIRVKAMEAPFSVIADPELIRLGHECGWGEKNSAGFGCVARVRD